MGTTKVVVTPCTIGNLNYKEKNIQIKKIEHLILYYGVFMMELHVTYKSERLISDGRS